MKVLDIFSGIGGFSLGLERAGMKTIAFCEKDAFCRTVLRKHWPNVPIFKDIGELHAKDLSQTVDIVCGGYPCQPFSLAGKRRGERDDRHLWPQVVRIIRELDAIGNKPSWCLFENVVGHVSLGLDTVLSDLESEGYSAWPFIIPACAVGLPHRRDRVWIIAHSDSSRRQKCDPAAKPKRQRFDNRTYLDDIEPFATKKISEPQVLVADDGVPYGLARRIKAIGNSLVPQIAEVIGRAILHSERKTG